MADEVKYAIDWDDSGKRFYETGVDRGVFYSYVETKQNDTNYVDGVAWNGLTQVTQSPSGAEANDIYADNIKYLSLRSAEQFGATIEAYTYPDEFAECDGSAIFENAPGVVIGQQARKKFGMSYRTRIGNDVSGDDYGYKIHLVYSGTVSPSEKAYQTVNDSPEAITFSWELTTEPIAVGTIGGKEYRPVAHIEIDSSKVTDKTTLANFEKILYGTSSGSTVTKGYMPLPAAVINYFSTDDESESE